MGPDGCRIEDHGVVGDLHTVALVTLDGTVDFLCLPRFDSPSVFASLLDAERGGAFRIAPRLEGARHRQRYLPDTNVLLTRFLADDGVAELADYMPIEPGGARHDLWRRVRTVTGTLRYRMSCRPRFAYGCCPHRAERCEGGVVFTPANAELGALRLRATVPIELDGADAVAEFSLAADEQACFVLEPAGGPDAPVPCSEEAGAAAFERTATFWRAWLHRCTYQGRWRETVHRSALALKLLTSARYGSMVAAGTFGLPEGPAGDRNWDYRFTWIRDSAFAMRSLLELGFHDEVHAFFRWIEARCREGDEARGPLQPIYRLDGGTTLRERILGHFHGYRGARPVRVGNAAADQLQLDLYGEVLQALEQADRYESPMHHGLWQRVARIADWVAAHWSEPDDGIWETRAGRRSFCHSRVLCWVALDRALRIADRRSLPAPRDAWREARDAIYHDVMEHFWDPEHETFLQHLEGDTLDAALLQLPLVGFVSPTDPRWLSTLRAIERRLIQDSLVYRYDPARFDDGVRGHEGTFNACTFWYVECLARRGDLRKARLVFEKALAHANHLGLFAEQLGPAGEHLGNFPQALTHLALVSAAIDLDARLDRSGEPDL